MKVKVKSIASTTLLLACLFIMAMSAGCSSEQSGSQATGNAGNASQADKKQEIIYAVSKDINDMNPHLYTGSMHAQGMVYESLVENTAEGIKPLLAESWDISEDGMTYTFQLRNNVTFHDGSPFNAEAVKRNMEAVQENAKKHSWIKLSSKIVGMTAIDEDTFELKLSEPYYPALVELSMTRPYVFLSPADFIDGGTKDGVQGYHGTGPYKLAEHKTDEYAVFQANKDYWGGAPAIQQIVAKVLPAGETTFLALQTGEVNMVFTDDRGADSLDVDAMERLAASGKFRIERSDPINTKMIVANSSRSDNAVSEKPVRQAIWHAIDRTTISEQIFDGTETPAHTLFSSNVNYANVELAGRDYDPDKARALLEEAGWLLQEGAVVRSKQGQSLSMELYYDVASASQKTQAEYLQSALKEIGIEIAITGEESSSIANRRATGEYDLLFNQTWGLAYDPQSTIAAFASESSYLHTTRGIANADELYQNIEDVMVSTDEEKRNEMYANILSIVHEEAVFIPITNGSVTVVAASGLQNITFKQTQFELPFESMYME